MFILGVASRVESVGGRTTHERWAEPARDGEQGDLPREWTNSFFQRLAEEVVDKGVARDITEAYTLVIPAFHRYGLLPTEPSTD